MEAREPLILFYTAMFGKMVDTGAIGPCRMPGRWTNDRRRIAEASAVVFHIPDLREAGDARKYPGQFWVAWCQESHQNYPVLRDPSVMAHFDLRMTYESDADVWIPYIPKKQASQQARAAPVQPKVATAPIAMFQSSRYNLSGREGFVSELQRHIPIHSYGRYLNNASLDGADLGSETKLRTISRYPFCIAFENSICADYVTEKLYDPLRAGSVPIYLGAPNVAEFAPENSYIDASRFPGPRQLAEYLRHLLEATAEYQAYFDWRSKPFAPQFQRRLDAAEEQARCRLLAKVHERLAERGSAPSGRSRLPFGIRASVRAKWSRWRKKTSRRVSRVAKGGNAAR